MTLSARTASSSCASVSPWPGRSRCSPAGSSKSFGWARRPGTNSSSAAIRSPGTGPGSSPASSRWPTVTRRFRRFACAPPGCPPPDRRHPVARAGQGRRAGRRHRPLRSPGRRPRSGPGSGGADASGSGMKKRRPPLDTSGGRAIGPTEFLMASQVIEKSGVLPVLTPLIETRVGRPRTLTLKAFLVAAQVNALHRHHQGHLVEIARALNAFTPDQLAALGVTGWEPEEAYDRTERLLLALSRVLEEGPVVDG